MHTPYSSHPTAKHSKAECVQHKSSNANRRTSSITAHHPENITEMNMLSDWARRHHGRPQRADGKGTAWHTRVRLHIYAPCERVQAVRRQGALLAQLFNLYARSDTHKQQRNTRNGRAYNFTTASCSRNPLQRDRSSVQQRSPCQSPRYHRSSVRVAGPPRTCW